MKSAHSTPTGKLLAALSAIPLFAVSAANAQIFINEVEYDNVGTDTAEWLEIAGLAGSQITTDWSIEMVNGGNGAVYGTYALSAFTFANESNGWGFYVVGIGGDFTPTGWVQDIIQNGAPDMIRLKNASGDVVQAISYEGAFSGYTSVGGIDSNSVAGSIFQQTTNTTGFVGGSSWVFGASTLGAVNTGQTFQLPVVVTDVSIGAGLVFVQTDFGGATFTAANRAVFDGVAGTVQVSGAVASTGLKFVTTGYELGSATASDTITLTGAVEVVESSSATIGAKVTGANNLAKTGAGSLTVSNADNDFVGTVTISAGVLNPTSDGALGAAGNDINLSGGTLAATGNLALNAGRDVTGSGGISVGGGNTLTLNGTVNTSGIKVSGTGTLAVAGASNTIGLLEFAAANQVTGNALALTGVTSSAYAGTAVVANAIDFGNSADRTLNVVGDVELSGALTQGGATRRLIKTGTGNLTLSGDQSGNLGGIRLGLQGTTPSDGGTLTVNADNALGATTFQLNSGTLTSATERTLANPLSIGGRTNNGVSASTLSGADMTFTGTGNGFFAASGTSGQLALDVNNATLVTGSWIATSGTGSVTGIDLGGSGRLALTGDLAAVTQTWTLTDTISFFAPTTLGGGVVVNNGTTFGGGADITGAAGLTVALGATLEYVFDISVATIFTTAFNFGGGSGLIELDFSGTAREGTFDLVTSASAISGFTANQFSIVNLGAGYTGTVGLTANALQITVSAIPEPSAFAALAGLAALGGAITRRRRRAV